MVVILSAATPLGGGAESKDLLLTCRRLQTLIPGATNRTMNKAIVTYNSFDEMKDAELRDWQALPAHERMRAVAEMALAAWRMKEPTAELSQMDKNLAHLPRPKNARMCEGGVESCPERSWSVAAQVNNGLR